MPISRRIIFLTRPTHSHPSVLPDQSIWALAHTRIVIRPRRVSPGRESLVGPLGFRAPRAPVPPAGPAVYAINVTAPPGRREGPASLRLLIKRMLGRLFTYSLPEQHSTPTSAPVPPAESRGVSAATASPGGGGGQARIHARIPVQVEPPRPAAPRALGRRRRDATLARRPSQMGCLPAGRFRQLEPGLLRPSRCSARAFGPRVRPEPGMLFGARPVRPAGPAGRGHGTNTDPRCVRPSLRPLLPRSSLQCVVGDATSGPAAGRPGRPGSRASPDTRRKRRADIYGGSLAALETRPPASQGQIFERRGAASGDCPAEAAAGTFPYAAKLFLQLSFFASELVPGTACLGAQMGRGSSPYNPAG